LVELSKFRDPSRILTSRIPIVDPRVEFQGLVRIKNYSSRTFETYGLEQIRRSVREIDEYAIFAIPKCVHESE